VSHRSPWIRCGGSRTVAILLVGVAVLELAAGRFDRPVLPMGHGDIATISPTLSLPIDWRRAPGVGPVLAARLANAAAHGRLTRPSDLQSVHGVGDTTAGRIASCVRWSVVE
jgi:hypothetical protein